MDANRDDLRFFVDRLVVSGRRVFGWGWAAHREAAVRQVVLVVRGDGWERRLPAGSGLSRHDVEAAHPGLVNAGTCGFVLTGFLEHDAPRHFALELQFEDGTRRAVDISASAESLDGAQRRRRRIAWLARAVWRRLRRGDLLGIVRRARAQSYSARSLDDLGIVETLLPELRRQGDVCLVFDHNMGGGANHYRRNAVARRTAAGQAVLLCTYNLPILEYRLHLHRPGAGELVFAISDFHALERVIDAAPVSEIFVNSPVSFDEPLLLAEWLTRMRAAHPRVRLTLTMHDYFAICPSFVLLDADGRFCGVPSVTECGDCLKRHQASYVALSPPSEPGPWRALWGRCLEAADEVRCFSEAARALLLKAYPALKGRTTLVPHHVDFVPARLPRVDARAPLVVGIVGEITPQKGALLVRDMMKLVDARHPGIRVVVIGTLDTAHDSPRLKVTGPYRREQLPDLIEDHGVNVVFFPSIWPETFSYVVAELTRLRVPIVAFDIGAPVERLRGYGKMRLCAEISAPAALATLIEFHADLAMVEASAA